MATEPDSAAGEGYRRLRTAVITAEGSQPATIVVAGASAHRSVAVTATNLAIAIAIARVGNTVTLVDGETSDNDVAGMLDLEERSGLSEVLLAGGEVADAVQPTKFSSLSALPGGTDRAAAAERYLSVDMQRVLESLRRRTQHVLVAAPPVASADGEALIRLADGVILVVDRGSTTYTELAAAMDELGRLAVPLIGVVLAPAGDRGAGAAQRPRAAPPSSSDVSHPASRPQGGARIGVSR